MDFIPCVKWVPRGVTSGRPEKVALTRDELQEIFNEPDGNDSEIDASHSEEEEDKYHFDNYDQPDDNVNYLGIGSLALYSANPRDPHINIPGMDEDDSDDEDDEIKPNDNLIVVGKGFRDNSSMESIEVHVYNEEEGDMYAHHDIMISSCPLCLDVVQVENEDRQLSSFIAVGLMSACIELYDLNVINPIKPEARLGTKKKKKDPKTGHTEAVLDITVNKTYPHILASSSADNTVALWDLETTKLSNKFDDFEGNVENIKWDTENGHCLLACDNKSSVKLLDCREYSTVKEWKVNSEALIGYWDSNNSNNFFVGTSKGKIYNFDKRMDSRIFKIKAHETDITGLSSVSGYQGVLVSTCVSGELKVWDVKGPPYHTVFNKSFNIEQLHALDSNPDNPLIAAVGGAQKKGSFFSTLKLNKRETLNDMLTVRKIAS